MRFCSFGGLAAFVILMMQVGVEGVVGLERLSRDDTFVSRETAERFDRLALAKGQFTVACEASRDAQRTLEAARECTGWSLPQDGPSCYQVEEGARLSSQIAHDEMDAAVATRKRLARELNYGYFASLAMGTSAYTHAQWLCADPYASNGVVIKTTFSKTY